MSEFNLGLGIAIGYGSGSKPELNERPAATRSQSEFILSVGRGKTLDSSATYKYTKNRA